MKLSLNSILRLVGVLFLLTSATVTAQQQYNDVVLLVNTNSAVSGQIGTYFAAHRAIPAANIIKISVPTTEEITDADFVSLRSQVETAITSAGLTSKINFIVTTKGMPLKIKRANAQANASVESELSLILGKYAVYIGQPSRIPSPYYGVRSDFSHTTYDIYLVTRLDGYTVNDVYAMIDHASIVPTAVPSGAKFVLDGDPGWDAAAPQLNSNLTAASTALKAKSLGVTLDNTATYLTNQTSVMGYASWGSNDHSFATMTGSAAQHNTYLPGAIAETYVSTSGRSFTTGLTYGQSDVADMIAEGITGVKAYVYEPYATAMANVGTLFPMYAEGYTMAEAFYSASPYLSWMDVIVGDPKGRMVNSVHNTTPLPVELTSFTVTPATNSTVLNWNTATEVSNYGFDIERKGGSQPLFTKIGFIAGAGTSNAPHSYTYTDPTAPTAAYTYRLKQIDTDGSFIYSSEITIKAVTAVVSTGGVPTEFELGQNYPNPFNPSTNVNFTIPMAAFVHLAIYDVAGREVATIVNAEMQPGAYTVQWNAKDFPSGVYFYRLNAGSFSSVKKLLLQK